jgi:hypothetical protein
MQVYTQIHRPSELNEDDVWIPCLKTFTVDHPPAPAQPLIITHIESINHYQHSLDPLLAQKVYAVGAKTYDRLVAVGFEAKNIHWRHQADDLKLIREQLGPLTWLRGDKFSKDFSQVPEVTTIQTYQSQPDPNAIRQILKLEPDVIHVYSDAVLKELEIRSWCHTQLRHVQSADPDHSLWLKCDQFDPNV